MLIQVSIILNSRTFKYQMIHITNSKITLIMASREQNLEAWEALAVPDIVRHRSADCRCHT